MLPLGRIAMVVPLILGAPIQEVLIQQVGLLALWAILRLEVVAMEQSVAKEAQRMVKEKVVIRVVPRKVKEKVVAKEAQIKAQIKVKEKA